MPTITDLIDILIPGEPKTYPLEGVTVRSVTSIIDAAGFSPDFSRVPPDVMALAKERGKAVHKACEYVDSDTLDCDSLDPLIRGYVEGYIRFRGECHVVVIASEQPLLTAAKNGFGGTPDLLCFLNGKRAVVDRKTTDATSPAARLQTAAYKELAWLVRNEMYEYRFGLRLFKNGTYKLVPHLDILDVHCFWKLKEYVDAKEARDHWMKHYYLNGGQNNGNGSDKAA